MQDTATDLPDLLAEAQQVLGTRDVQLTGQAHGQRLGVTDSVSRVTADGASVIVKVVSPGTAGAEWRGSTQPHSYRYWKREPLVYAAGLPRSYQESGVALPRLLASFERVDGRVSLWLEDVSGSDGADWTLDETRTHARRLGRAQGLCAVDGTWRDSPVPWSRGYLREYLDTPDATSPDIDWPMLERPDAWAAPLMSRHFDPGLRDAVTRLCRDRYAFVGMGDSLPQTLCHHDAWPQNFYGWQDRTVLIDWAFPGEGWLGSDIGNFVSDTALDLLRPAGELPALDETVFAGYCRGLREAGWDGDERLVRLGTCLMAAKWTWLIPVMLGRALSAYDHTVYGDKPVDADALYAERARVFRMLVAWADEARGLAADLFGKELTA